MSATSKLLCCKVNSRPVHPEGKLAPCNNGGTSAALQDLTQSHACLILAALDRLPCLPHHREGGDGDLHANPLCCLVQRLSDQQDDDDGAIRDRVLMHHPQQHHEREQDLNADLQ